MVLVGHAASSLDPRSSSEDVGRNGKNDGRMGKIGGTIEVNALI